LSIVKVVIGANQYVIRGGVEVRERLRVLSRVMHESTSGLFNRLGISGRMDCLDVGCGGGDVTMELARRVDQGGTALGIDMDATNIELARGEAAAGGLTNVDFAVANVTEARFDAAFDLVYARFLLTHLQDPQAMVRQFVRWLRPGGRFVLEDVDFSGNFVYPDSAAFRRYRELYCAAVRQTGGGPDIGPRLPLLLEESGCTEIGVSITQRVGLEGEVKLLNPLTMENIADTVVNLGLASRGEVASLARELYEFAARPHTLAGTPRIVQAWARKGGRT
jgi:SAM-dependent methyltransferase